MILLTIALAAAEPTSVQPTAAPTTAPADKDCCAKMKADGKDCCCCKDMAGHHADQGKSMPDMSHHAH